MIEPKEYQVNEKVSEQQFVNAGFTNKPDYFVTYKPLYKNLVNLILMVDKEDYYHVAKVNDCNGEIYFPFYNQEYRNNDSVAEEVIKNYNKFMDGLVKAGIFKNKRSASNTSKKTKTATKINKTATIKIRYLTDINKIEKITNGDWIDLRAAETAELKAGEFKLISLGVAMQLPDGYEAHVVPRSSTYKTYGVLQTNSMGIIDNTYCGDNDVWMFPAYATRDTVIHKNDRICQFRIMKTQGDIVFEEVNELKNKGRGGFGSTGRN